MDKEELQDKVGRYLWADHALDTNKYEVAAPEDWERVCQCPEDSRSYIYECLLTRLGVRFHFTNFEMELMQRMMAAPTQLHPSVWGRMKGF